MAKANPYKAQGERGLYKVWVLPNGAGRGQFTVFAANLWEAVIARDSAVALLEYQEEMGMLNTSKRIAQPVSGISLWDPRIPGWYEVAPERIRAVEEEMAAKGFEVDPK